MDCVIKKGAKVKGGYVKQSYLGRASLAHRVAYCVHHGLTLADIDGKVVLHICDNPPCINPCHLSLGMASDNMRDMVAKRRERGPKRRKLTVEQAREVLASNEPYVLGKRYGASKQVVGALLRGETYYDARM